MRPHANDTAKTPAATVDAGRIPKVIVAAAAAPALVATLCAALFVVLETAGRAPLVGDAPRNIAEAAGLGLGTEVLRMLRQGADPTRPLPVSPQIISSEITQVTALEAAVWSRRVRLLHLFDREGLLRDDETRQHVACVATAIGFDDGVEALFPEGFGGCDPDQLIRAIRRRVE